MYTLQRRHYILTEFGRIGFRFLGNFIDMQSLFDTIRCNTGEERSRLHRALLREVFLLYLSPPYIV